MAVFLSGVIFKGRSLAGIRAAAAKAVPRPFGGIVREYLGFWDGVWVYYIMELYGMISFAMFFGSRHSRREKRP